MGHSSLSGGSLNSSSSNNSAARFLHAFLCRGRCITWQLRQQYLTSLQAVHDLSLFSAVSPLPQLAHEVSAVSLVADIVIGVGCQQQ